MTRARAVDCDVCNDLGMVRDAHCGVTPCPGCNPDSGFAPGEYQAALVKQKGRCGFAKGGGGRTCPKERGHKGDHVFICGR